MSQQLRIKPTESELEILHILWEKGKATVRDVYEEISQTKDIGYTTTLKLMQIMFDKGLVSRDDSSRSHIYSAIVTREATQQQMVGKMIQSLFAGKPSGLILQALGNHRATQEELDEIQKMLDELKKR